MRLVSATIAAVLVLGGLQPAEATEPGQWNFELYGGPGYAAINLKVTGDRSRGPWVRIPSPPPFESEIDPAPLGVWLTPRSSSWS